MKLLDTVSGGGSKSSDYFDSIGVNNYEFVYISTKAVNSTGVEFRDGRFVRSDSLSVDTAPGNVNFHITQNNQNSATLLYNKSNKTWVFPSVSGYNSTTVSIYGVAI